MNAGIYKIENVVTGDLYIGQSVNLSRRKAEHLHSLNNGKHRNIHLQRAWDKYGEGSFVFSVALFCESNELTYYEQALVDKWRSTYNICRECVCSTMGVPNSPAARAKMSKSNMGRTVSEEYKKVLSERWMGEKNPNFGKHRTAEEKKRLSDANTGKHMSEEAKKKLSDFNKGKTLSEEHKKKIAISNSGKHPSLETRAKSSLAHKGQRAWMIGKHHTEESKRRISVSKKGIKCTREAIAHMSTGQVLRRERERATKGADEG